MKVKKITHIPLYAKLKGFESLNDKIKRKQGNEIRNERIKKGISPKQVRRDIGVQEHVLKNIENGVSDYTISSINKLKYYLKLITIKEYKDIQDEK